MWNWVVRGVMAVGGAVANSFTGGGSSKSGNGTPYGGLAGGGYPGRRAGHDPVGHMLNKMWLTGGVRSFLDSVSPQVSQQVGVVAIGMPWSTVEKLYRFAISVANGLLNNSIAGPTSTKYIEVEINHTDKIVKVVMGYQCSGFLDANVLSASGSALMSTPVPAAIQGGPWPRWMQSDVNKGKVVIEDRLGNQVTVTGDRFNDIIDGGGGTSVNVAQDEPADMPGIVFGNSMYGERDMLLQAPPYSNGPCEKVPAPKPNTQAYALLGIT